MIEHRKLDVPFYPYDDISYHLDTDKTGVRCVICKPNYGAYTQYIDRTISALSKNICMGETGFSMGDIFSEEVEYTSNGVPKTLCIIYMQAKERNECCVRYDDVPLVFGTGCVIAGEGFTDLTLDQCYGLVMSARLKRKDDTVGVSVNITKDMDLIPRLIADE